MARRENGRYCRPNGFPSPEASSFTHTREIYAVCNHPVADVCAGQNFSRRRALLDVFSEDVIGSMVHLAGAGSGDRSTMGDKLGSDRGRSGRVRDLGGVGSVLSEE